MSYFKITTRKTIISCALFFILAFTIQRLITSNVPIDINKVSPNFMETVKKYGYKAEWHNVTTPDGYILSLFRIPPNSPTVGKFAKNRAIFLQHGLASTGFSFAFLGPNVSLALILSDAGYDVWLGNCRGNIYSRRHQSLSPDDSQFWDFAIDEIATKDLPTMIDYALNYSNSSSMSYIGFSLGTTPILFLLSEKTEYNDKLTSVTLVAPIVKWHKLSTIRKLIIYSVRLMKWLHPSGAFESFSQNSIVSTFFNKVCVMNNVLLRLCYYPFELMMGTMDPFNTDEMRKFVPQLFSGSSFKLTYQCLNIHDNGSFIHYTHDKPQMNLERYGQEEVPVYNLSNILVPIAIFQGGNDPVSVDDDVRHFMPLLKNSKKIYYESIKEKAFAHWDFIMSKGKKLVYSRMLEIIDEFYGDSSL